MLFRIDEFINGKIHFQLGFANIILVMGPTRLWIGYDIETISFLMLDKLHSIIA